MTSLLKVRITHTFSAVALLAVTLGSGAQAAAPADEDTLIRQGLDLREKRDDEGALRLFRQAHEQFKSARSLAQLAFAEQALGHWVDAETHLAQAMGENHPWIAKNKAVLTQAMKEIQGRLGWLQLSGGDAPADVVINGERAGRMPLAGPLRVLAGSVGLEVRASGYLPVVRSIIVPGGGTARETIVLVPVTTENAVPPVARATGATTTTSSANVPPSAIVERPVSHDAPVPGAWSTKRKVGLGLLATGTAFLGGGVGFMLVHNKQAEEYEDAGCSTVIPNQGPDGCKSRGDSANLTQTLSIVGYAAGGVLAGVGVYLLLTDDGVSGSGGPSRTISFRCAPSLGAAVSCAGTF